MSLTIEATYENGVFVPAERPPLAERARVRLTIDSTPPPAAQAVNPVEFRRRHRIKLDAKLSQEIASSPEFLPEES
jgi:predicted DNA-binding antitoxin AbrB/MazE fold protein